MWCYHCCSFGALLLCAMTLGSVLLTITKLYATFPLLQHLLALKVLHSCAVDHMQSCPVGSIYLLHCGSHCQQVFT